MESLRKIITIAKKERRELKNELKTAKDKKHDFIKGQIRSINFFIKEINNELSRLSMTR